MSPELQEASYSRRGLMCPSCHRPRGSNADQCLDCDEWDYERFQFAEGPAEQIEIDGHCIDKAWAAPLGTEYNVGGSSKRSPASRGDGKTRCFLAYDESSVYGFGGRWPGTMNRRMGWQR